MRREEAREGKEGFKTLRKEENEEGRKEGEDEGRLRVGIKRKHQRCHCWKRPQKLHCYFIAGTAQMREAQRGAETRLQPRVSAGRAEVPSTALSSRCLREEEKRQTCAGAFANFRASHLEA